MATKAGVRYEWYKNGQRAPFKLTEIASIQKGTNTSSLTIVSIQTSASYYCKVFQANGSFAFDGPFVVTVNYGCVGRMDAAGHPTGSQWPEPDRESGQAVTTIEGSGLFLRN